MFVSRRTGFTLVELLVVIAIMGILVSQLLPAVFSAREVAHRAECVRNSQRLILAVQSYQNANAFYPAGVTDTGGPIRDRREAMHHGWIEQLLPELDERAAYAHLDFKVSVYDKKNAEVAEMRLPMLICPVDDDSRPHSSYAACQNDVEAPIDADNHGVFFLNSHLRPNDITDGLAYTLFLAEKLSIPSDVELGWMSGTRATLRNTGTPLNLANRPPAKPSPLYVGGFGSNHAGGAVSAAFGDGAVRTLSDAIDAQLLKRLGNRADGQLVRPQDLDR